MKFYKLYSSLNKVNRKKLFGYKKDMLLFKGMTYRGDDIDLKFEVSKSDKGWQYLKRPDGKWDRVKDANTGKLLQLYKYFDF